MRTSCQATGFPITSLGRVRERVPVPGHRALPSLSSFCAAVSKWGGLRQSRLSFLHRVNAGVLPQCRRRV